MGSSNTCPNNPENNDQLKKPVIYLYPEENFEVEIKLILKIVIQYVYIQSLILLKINGKLKHLQAEKYQLEKKYPYLFWKAHSYNKKDLTKGFIVKQKELKNLDLMSKNHVILLRFSYLF